MPDQAIPVRGVRTPPDRQPRRKPDPYEDVRPAWPTDLAHREAISIAQYEICDAILRNNHDQAMHALGIIRWERDGANVEFDFQKTALLNPNLIDFDAPWAWQFFRREMSHRSLLHEAVAYSSVMSNHGNDTTITRMLLARGALIQLRDDSGNTPLHIAAYANNVGAARLLVEAGADVNLRSRRGQTALHTGVHHENIAVCEYLLGVGANPDIRNVRNQTPAEMAIANDAPETYAAFASARARQAMLAVISAADKQTPNDLDDDTPRPTPRPR
jgi:hypothetical protein